MHPLISIVLTAILGVTLIKLVRFSLAQFRIRKLANKLPAPKGIPILGNVLDIGHLDAVGFTKYVLEKANEIRAQGESLMSINILGETFSIPLDGPTVKHILDSQVEVKKGVGYDFLFPWLGEGLLMSVGKKWYTRRKMLTPTFHFQQLAGYLATFNAESKIATEILREFNGKEVDVFPYIKRCALDIICETAMGRSVHAQYNPDHKYVICVRNLLFLTNQWVLNPKNWFPPYWYLSGNAAKYRESLKIVLEFTRNIIYERQQMRAKKIKGDGKRINFLDLLLEMNENGTLSEEDIREEVDTFMFEGHDTTSSGTAWTIWCLAQHKKVQDRLREEIYNVVGENDEEITMNHLKEMTYLDLVIKEVFRLYAPVPMVTRSLQNDFQCGKYLLPKGSMCTICPLVLHRNKQVWGDDVEQFDPERFMDGNASDRHPFDYIPFSAGLRNCIGQKFALYEAKIMVSWLIRKYQFSSNIKMEDNEFGMEAVLRPKLGIPVKLVRL